MTTAEYLTTPESLLPTELIYGALYVREAPSLQHQRAVKHLLLALNEFVEQRQCGEVFVAPLDVVLDYERALIVQPDLLFVSNDRERIISKAYINGAPDMVLEVLSPRPRVGDLNQRLEWFARYGVRECWVFRLEERRLDIVHCEAGVVAGRTAFAWNDRLASQVFPSFDRPLREVILRGRYTG